MFVEIGKITYEVNGVRKRMPSINFTIREILRMMKIPCDDIQLSKSKKTLAFYNMYWAKIMALRGDKINNITQ